jgi:hypothetical protein
VPIYDAVINAGLVVADALTVQLEAPSTVIPLSPSGNSTVMSSDVLDVIVSDAGVVETAME